MRIAFLTPEYVSEADSDGGLANYLHGLTCSLKSFGHEPVIFVASQKDETIVREGIEIQRVKVRSGLFDGIISRSLYLGWLWQSWRLNQRLKEIHAKNKFDVVQYTNYMATGFFRPPSIPAVVRLSSLQYLLDRAYTIPADVVRRTLYQLEMSSLRKVRSIYSPSILIAKSASAILHREVRVLRPPFFRSDPEIDGKLYAHTLGDKKYVLFFGSLGVLKGVKVIADMIFELLDSAPGLFFVLAGKDCGYQGEAMMDHVWRAARQHRDRVLHLGVLRQGELRPVLSNAEAVILPSLVDNLPNTCIESLAQGKVVLGTRGASLDELIRDGENGYLCEKGNPADLLDKIRKILALSSEERLRIGTAAKSTIEQLLSPGVVIPELIRFYEDAIAASAK